MRFILVACGFMCAGPALAETVYDCTITSRGGKNIPDYVIVTFDAKSESGTAMDGFVDYYVGKPIKARVVKNNDKRLTVSYSLENITAKHGGTILGDETRLTVVKASGEAIVSYKQNGGSVTNGSGTCKNGK